MRVSCLTTAFAAGLTVAVSATLWMVPAVAQQGGKGAMATCRTDIATFCRGIEAGGGKRMQCLIANIDKLSPDCASVVDSRMAARGAKKAAKADGGAVTAQTPQSTPLPQAQPGTATPAQAPVDAAAQPKAAVPAGTGGKRPMAACASDLQTLCGTVPRGGGARIQCLRDNQAKLSADCNAALADATANKADSRAACKNDAQRLCGAVKGPERRACLAKNEAQLSPACATALVKRAGRTQAK